MSTTALPIACDREAIPPSERAAHAYAARLVFGGDATIEEVTLPQGEGWRVTVDAGAFDDVVRWVTWERLCCPFLRFVVELEPAGGAVTLTMTGPSGTIAFLEQEIR